MTFDEELRRILRELAAEGRPVDLGRAALAAARHRRRTHLAMAAVAAAAVAAISAPMVLVDASRAPRPAAPEPAPSAGSVVTIYYPEDGTMSPLVLDPTTGGYHPATVAGGPVLVSPDLQLVAGLAPSGKLRVASTTTQALVSEVDLPWAGVGLSWSPDSTRIAVDGTAAGTDQSSSYLDTVTIVDVTSGDAHQVMLDLPAGLVGVRGRSGRDAIGWWGPDRLVVPTADPRISYPTPPGSRYPRNLPLITGLAVLDLTGRLVQQVPINQEQLTSATRPHTGLMWQPYGPVRNERMLLVRQREAGTLQLTTLELSTGTLLAQPADAVLPPVPLPAALRGEDGTWPGPNTSEQAATLPLDIQAWAEVTASGEFLRTPLPVAWLADGSVLLDTGRWAWTAHRYVVPREHHRIDLATGEMYPVELPVPDRRGLAQFGTAARLTPAAIPRAHVL